MVGYRLGNLSPFSLSGIGYTHEEDVERLVGGEAGRGEAGWRRG